MITVSEPIEGMPEKFETSLQKEVYELLDEKGIAYRRVENDPAVTMEDCKAIDIAFSNPTIKTVFLTNRQKTAFYLLAMPADKPFVTRDFGSALSVPRVSFASAELLMEILGTPHGAASPLSLLNDRECKVRAIFDREIMDLPKISITDTTLHGFVSLAPEALTEVFIPATQHRVEIIEL